MHSGVISPLMVLATMACLSGAAAGEEVRSLRLRVGPCVRFLSPDSAAVSWDMDQPTTAVVLYGKGKELNRTVEISEASASPRAILSNLEPGTEYGYRIKAVVDGVEQFSPIYSLDTSFNYTVHPLPPKEPSWPDRETAPPCAEAAAHILSDTHVTKGYCVVYGLGSGRLAYELAKRSELTVIGFDEGVDRVSGLQKRFYEARAYGTRITFRHVPSLDRLPLTSCLANLIVSESLLSDGPPKGSAAEVYRILRPGGGVACLGRPAGAPNRMKRETLERWFEAGSIRAAVGETSGGLWARVVREPLNGIGRWTHQYGDTGNTADSGDSLGGCTGTSDMAVQWIGRPGGDFGIDRNPRMPAPLSIGGRLFHQGMNRMIALDAYNGAVLWTLEIPDLRRVNLPRDASNWCADEDSLYVAVDDGCWRLDASTGDRKSVFFVDPSGKSDTYEWGYVARSDGLLYGSKVMKPGSYKEYWGRAEWYDDASGAGTAKVCSDALFALDKETGTVVWAYVGGAIINTTITISGGRVCFVESRHPDVKASTTGRIISSKLWSDQFLVALDSLTGRKQWEQPIDTADGTVVFFMSHAGETIVIMSSTKGKYHLYAYGSADGRPQWQAEHAWTGDDHSGHMQHPVVMGGRVYQEPCVYDLNTGRRLTDTMGRHAGCAPYAGTKGALLYRGAGRRISLWDIQTGAISGWETLRPSCWLSVVTAGGLVLAPEGGGGCSCGNWLETSIGFIPKKWQGGK